jgi:hypothetical protein
MHIARVWTIHLAGRMAEDLFGYVKGSFSEFSRWEMIVSVVLDRHEMCTIGQCKIGKFGNMV